MVHLLNICRHIEGITQGQVLDTCKDIEFKAYLEAVYNNKKETNKKGIYHYFH